MTVTPSLTLGEILQIATMIVGVTAIIVGLRVELKALRLDIQAVKSDMKTHETTLFSMFGQLQRVIGIVETEQRTPPR